MADLNTLSYACLYLSEHSEKFSIEKQQQIEELIFDYSKEAYLSYIDSSNNKVEITKNVFYDATRCDSSGRDKDSCGKCIDSCEFSALSFDLVAKNISILHQNCTACGKCVNVCPSAAIQYSNFNLETLVAILESSKGYTVLFAREADLALGNCKLPDNTLIVPIDNYYVLNEIYLLIASFKTGGRVMFLDRALLPATLLENIESANKVVKASTGFGGVLFLNEISSGYGFSEVDLRVENMSARMALSTLLKASVGSQSVIVDTKSNVFAKVAVDSNCTACMGCAFVCKGSAFVANEEKMALTLNESLCTACGFCESVCPENSIKIEKGKLDLSMNGCSHIVVATDEMFHCVECGKPFATKKAIEKVAGVFAMAFVEDYKKRTLYCCADCKPKIMLSQSIKNSMEANA